MTPKINIKRIKIRIEFLLPVSLSVVKLHHAACTYKAVSP
jgi:hypothetical protein